MIFYATIYLRVIGLYHIAMNLYNLTLTHMFSPHQTTLCAKIHNQISINPHFYSVDHNFPRHPFPLYHLPRSPHLAPAVLQRATAITHQLPAISE